MYFAQVASGGFRGGGFFRFHAVFGKIWQNGMLAPPPPPGELAPLPGEIMDPPLVATIHFCCSDSPIIKCMN